jgi:hypothetical protein
MNTEQKLRDLLGKPFARVLLQGVLLRTLRRNPMGFLATLLIRRAMAGDGRVFGMDLASRRQNRWAWLMALLQAHLAKTAAKSSQPAIRRRLSR